MVNPLVNNIFESERLALLEAQDYSRCEESLSHFIQASWQVLEPSTEYKHNWHIDCIAEHLEAVFYGQILNLIINMPPRYLKSISATVCFPAWCWIKKPALRFFKSSYSADLSTKHNTDARELIKSAWYQAAWCDRFSLADDQDRKTLFKNNHRGQMFSTSVGGRGTGEGGDILITDDPINPKMAASEVLREGANTWRDQTLSTRKNDKKKSAEIIIMQRLHKKDLTGHVLKKDPDKWTTLILEGQATKDRVFIFPISKYKKQVEEGEYLHEEREGEVEHKQAKIDLGSMGYQGQYGQNPKISKDGFFKPKWWNRYTEIPMDKLDRVLFIDCAEKPGISNDYSAFAVWDKFKTGYYCSHAWRRKMAFPELEQTTKDKFYAFQPNAIVIEDKSAGIQLIQNLEAETTLPIIQYKPGVNSKEVRAAGAQPTVEAGNCWLPQGASWIDDFVQEHQDFPLGDNDDWVDTTSMMIDYFKNNNSGTFTDSGHTSVSGTFAGGMNSGESW